MNRAIHRKLLSGQPLLFAGDEPEKERLIKAEWLAEAARKPAKIDVHKAVIRGALDLQYVTFKEEVALIGCDIEELANFSYTNFKHKLILSGTTFHQGANFNSAHLEYDAELQSTQFPTGEATFEDLHVHGVFDAQSVHFGDGVEANFMRAQFDKSVFFNYASFEGEANFVGAQTGPQANFTGARFKSKDKPANFDGAKFDGSAFFENSVFKGEARFVGAQTGSEADFTGARFNSKDKPAIFDSAKIDGSAFFENSVFKGEARFVGAQIGSQANFTGARFNSKDKPAKFDSAKIDGVAFFQNSVFEGEARFVGAQIGSEANFTGARFNSKDKPAIFDSAKIDGDAFFQNSIFKGAANFDGAEIKGAAFFENAQSLEGSKLSFEAAKFQGGVFFQGATFQDVVDFRTAEFRVGASFRRVAFANKADFGASQFIGLAQFSASKGLPASPNQPSSPPEARDTVFNEVSFEHARFEHDARFDDVVFQGETSFRETSFMAVYFSPKGLAQGKKQFQGSVDLRGCVYEHVEVDRKSLLEHLAPYDRQPYTQLEKVFRVIGQDRKADEVYLERRRVEHQHLSVIREPLRWFGDLLYGWIANYGVRPYRLIAMSIVLLFLGMVFFSLPEAVSARDGSVPTELGVLTVLPPWDAFGVSLHQFLPVEVPIGSQWVPSAESVEVQIGFSAWALRFKMPPTTYATFFLRLAGWILVPLGIAAVTGLLRRVAP